MQRWSAQSLDGIIGDGAGMPWHLPGDLKHFKETTWGSPVIMGRHTWESLPVTPLPGRPNIIISSREAGPWSKGAYVYRDLPDFVGNAWVIGVSLADLIPHNAVYAPRITDDFDLVSESDWLASERGHVTVEGAKPTPLHYRFQRFEREA